MSATAGPCTGGCGAIVPHRFGTPAQTMCDGCSEILEQWRKLPAMERPNRIPFGRTVLGVYQRRDQ